MVGTPVWSLLWCCGVASCRNVRETQGREGCHPVAVSGWALGRLWEGGRGEGEGCVRDGVRARPFVFCFSSLPVLHRVCHLHVCMHVCMSVCTYVSVHVCQCVREGRCLVGRRTKFYFVILKRIRKRGEGEMTFYFFFSIQGR